MEFEDTTAVSGSGTILDIGNAGISITSAVGSGTVNTRTDRVESTTSVVGYGRVRSSSFSEAGELVSGRYRR